MIKGIIMNKGTIEKSLFMTSRHTVAEMIDRYINEASVVRPNTVRNQSSHLNWWRREMGHCYLDSVRPAVLVEYRKKLLSGVSCRGRPRSMATVNRYFSTLSRVFSVAVKEWEWLSSSPLRYISKLEEPAGRTRFLSEQEIKNLLDACASMKHRDLYTAVVLALSTCARRMELMSLHWKDIDLEAGVIYLHKTKNKTTRAIPLQSYALRLMRTRYHASINPSGLIFPSRLKPNQPISFRVSWEKALRLSGIKDFRWHDLRHTGASYLAMQGASLTELSEILGHKTLQMVKRYAHLSLPHTMQIVARMNQKLFQNPVKSQRWLEINKNPINLRHK